MLHSIDSLPAGTDELLVHVVYACTACGSFHAHTAAFRQVATLLNHSNAVPGLMHFGGLYLHCGIPMAPAGTAHRIIQAILPDGTMEAALPDVELTTEILQCKCGFRLELPA